MLPRRPTWCLQQCTVGRPDRKGRLWTHCASVSDMAAQQFAKAPYPSSGVELNYLAIMVNIVDTCISACSACSSAPAITMAQAVSTYNTTGGQL